MNSFLGRARIASRFQERINWPFLPPTCGVYHKEYPGACTCLPWGYPDCALQTAPFGPLPSKTPRASACQGVSEAQVLDRLASASRVAWGEETRGLGGRLGEAGHKMLSSREVRRSWYPFFFLPNLVEASQPKRGWERAPIAGGPRRSPLRTWDFGVCQGGNSDVKWSRTRRNLEFEAHSAGRQHSWMETSGKGCPFLMVRRVMVIMMIMMMMMNPHCVTCASLALYLRSPMFDLRGAPATHTCSSNYKRRCSWLDSPRQLGSCLTLKHSTGFFPGSNENDKLQGPTRKVAFVGIQSSTNCLQRVLFSQGSRSPKGPVLPKKRCSHKSFSQAVFLVLGFGEKQTFGASTRHLGLPPRKMSLGWRLCFLPWSTACAPRVPITTWDTHSHTQIVLTCWVDWLAKKTAFGQTWRCRPSESIMGSWPAISWKLKPRTWSMWSQ